MIDQWLIVGGVHFAATAVALKLLGFILPSCITCWYSCLANVLLFFVVAKFTFEFTKSWHLTEKLPPENKAIFITECGSKLGLNLAKLLASKGYHVFAGVPQTDSPEAKTLLQECSGRTQLVQIDVSSDSSVKQAVQYVQDNLGTSELWALVNNAEIQRGFEVEVTGIAEFEKTMEVNGFGPVRATKGFLPLLRQSRGRVINVTNPTGKLALPYITPYTMSKFAMMAFNECLKQELDVWGVKVVSVEPFFYREGLANPELVKRRLEDTLSKMDPITRDDYGTKYFKEFKTFIDFICSSTPQYKNKIAHVIENAIGLQHPNLEYRVSRNVVFQVLNYVLEHAPSLVTHLLVKILLFTAGIPKPQESGNYL